MRVSGLLRVIGPTSAPTGRGVCSCRCWRSCRARIAAASRLLQRCREATPAVAGSPSPTASYAFRPWVFESTSGRSEAQQQRRDLLQSLASRRSTLRCYPGPRVRFCSRLWQVRVSGAGQERPYRPTRPQPAHCGHASVRALQHTRSSTASIARRLILRQWRTLMMFLAVPYAHAAGAANDYGSLLKLAQDWRAFEQPVMSNCTPPHFPRSLRKGLIALRAAFSMAMIMTGVANTASTSQAVALISLRRM